MSDIRKGQCPNCGTELDLRDIRGEVRSNTIFDEDQFNEIYKTRCPECGESLKITDEWSYDRTRIEAEEGRCDVMCRYCRWEGHSKYIKGDSCPVCEKEDGLYEQ